MTPEQDASLLEAWRAGDRAAGDRLISANLDSVAKYVLRKVTHPQATEELVQEIFKEAVDRRDRIQGQFAPYVHGIARFKVLEYYRRKGSFANELSSSLCDHEQGPESTLGRSQEGHYIAKALRMLPVEQQELLYLFYIEGLSARQIAQMRGLRAAQVSGQVFRIRARAREIIEQLTRNRQQRESALRCLETWLAQFAEPEALDSSSASP